MKHAETVTFGGSALNRAAELRTETAQAELLARDDARILLLWRAKPVVVGAEQGPLELSWVSRRNSFLEHQRGAFLFLGLEDNGAPRFAADVSNWEPEEMPESINAFLDPSEQTDPRLPDGSRFVELRMAMTRLSPRDAEYAATARGLLEWHRTHGFCANCGAATEPSHAGWQRDCGSCGRHHFPRTDPVAIMLITHGNSVLMGRSPGWPEGMYSCLAGFIEPGETVEAAVRRETFEEAGVRVGAVEYLASQPWPFPASLMIGCRGEALTKDINIDPNEIEDAVWVTREEMMEVFEGVHSTIKPARKGAIAHFLILNWLKDCLN